MGIGIDGVKHPLALVEGSTENATLVTELLVGLRERGLDVTRPMFVGLDGSKALRKAVVAVLDRPVIHRCQLHEIRHVKDRLPQRLRSSVGRKVTNAYHANSTLEAAAALLAWTKNSTAPMPSRRSAYARSWTRRSRCCDWMYRLRSPGRCALRTASSR